MKLEHREIIGEILDDLDDFYAGVFGSRDAVSVVLRLHALTEHYLRQIAELMLPKGALITKSGRFTYAQLLTIVAATDIFDEKIILCLRRLNKIRNRLAHSRTPSLNIAEIRAAGQRLEDIYHREMENHKDSEPPELSRPLLRTVRKVERDRQATGVAAKRHVSHGQGANKLIKMRERPNTCANSGVRFCSATRNCDARSSEFVCHW